MNIKVTITTKPELVPVGTKVLLVKEPTNNYDNEAIQVIVNGGHEGYVSAHYKTRKPGTMSAGRALDKIESPVEGVVVEDGIVEVPVQDSAADEPDGDMGRMEHDERGDSR